MVSSEEETDRDIYRTSNMFYLVNDADGWIDIYMVLIFSNSISTVVIERDTVVSWVNS